MFSLCSEVTIDLGERGYRIVIGGGLLGNAASYNGLPRASGPDCE